MAELKIGKLDSEVLQSIVIDKIKFRRPEVLTRAGVGEDCAVIDFGQYECVVSTDPITADVKEMVGIKSPAELLQLQGKLLRRNFDVAVAFGSKNSEAMLKLANDAFAPLSTRVSQAAEKISKAA